MAINSVVLDIAERLKTNDQSLLHLDLNRLPLATITDEEVECILRALAHNFVIRSIRFFIPKSKNNALKDCVFSNKTMLEKVTVNSITCLDAWRGLFSALSGCTSLRELSIGQARALVHWNPLLGMNNASSEETSPVISLEMMETIRDIISTLPSLRKLSLRGFVVQDFRPLAQGLRMASLQELEIQQCSSDSGGDYWAELFGAVAKSTVEGLTIIECELNECANFDKLFTKPYNLKSQSLRTMRILACEMNQITIRQMLESVSESSLALLDLRGNTLDQTSCQRLSGIITRSSLRKVILEECRLGDTGVASLAKGIASSSTIHEINLRSNEISAIGCRVLVTELNQCENATLQTLDLSENFIGNEGAQAVASLLQRNVSYLHSLVLEGCNISDCGIMELCNSLQHRHCRMKELRLGQNEIESQGANALAELIASNSAIDSIDLSSCSISDDSAQIIADALAVNWIITKISLAYNGIENMGASHWGKAIERSKQLKSLELQGNRFDVDGLESIVRGIEKNYSLENVNVWNLHCFSFRRRKEIDNADKDARLVKLQKTMEYMLRLNRARRHATLHENLPEGLWPTILVNAYTSCGIDTAFYLLKHGPLINRSHF